jgi:four helix bundle protein
MEITKDVYLLTKHYPKDELYGLISQTRRAAVSIPANIAEGHERASTKEYIHHVSYA